MCVLSMSFFPCLVCRSCVLGAVLCVLYVFLFMPGLLFVRRVVVFFLVLVHTYVAMCVFLPMPGMLFVCAVVCSPPGPSTWMAQRHPPTPHITSHQTQNKHLHTHTLSYTHKHTALIEIHEERLQHQREKESGGHLLRHAPSFLSSPSRKGKGKTNKEEEERDVAAAAASVQRVGAVVLPPPALRPKKPSALEEEGQMGDEEQGGKLQLVAAAGTAGGDGDKGPSMLLALPAPAQKTPRSSYLNFNFWRRAAGASSSSAAATAAQQQGGGGDDGPGASPASPPDAPSSLGSSKMTPTTAAGGGKGGGASGPYSESACMGCCRILDFAHQAAHCVSL